MKKISLSLILLIGTSCISYAQTITIGTQVWTTKNLDVTTFINGDPILEVKTNKEWSKAFLNKQPAWCYYENDSLNGLKYGKLYNWYAVTDSRGLAPVGYHIPSEAEWTVLIDFLGGAERAGGKLKKTGVDLWQINNKFAINTSGFTGLPGGMRDHNGTFYWVGSHGLWWSSSKYNNYDAMALYLIYYDGNTHRNNIIKSGGLSVRCIRN